MCPKSNGRCPYKREKGEETQRHRREGPVKTEAGAGVVCPQAKEHQALFGERPEMESLSEYPEECNPANTLISDFWSLEL